MPSPQHHTGSQEARVPVPDLLLINLYHWASVSSLFKITGAGIENGLSGPFKLYCSEKVGLVKSDSSPGRREGYVWIRQTAQHQPTEIQKGQEMSPGLQSISHRLLPLPRGWAETLLQLYWDDEGPLRWWKGGRGGVRGYNGTSDSFSLEKRSQEGPGFKSPVRMGAGWQGRKNKRLRLRVSGTWSLVLALPLKSSMTFVWQVTLPLQSSDSTPNKLGK